MATKQPDNSPLRSEFSDDPDMAELVIEYVDKMPQRVHQMQTAFENSQREQPTPATQNCQQNVRFFTAAWVPSRRSSP